MREQLHLPDGLHGDLWFRHLHGFTMPSHQHDELEFNLVRSGHASYVVNGRRYRMAAGDAIWLFPEQDHVLVEISPNFSMWILVIHPFALRPHCRQSKWAPLLAGNPLGLGADGCRPQSRKRYSKPSMVSLRMSSSPSSLMRN